jgi:hypothetical protein
MSFQSYFTRKIPTLGKIMVFFFQILTNGIQYESKISLWPNVSFNCIKHLHYLIGARDLTKK